MLHAMKPWVFYCVDLSYNGDYSFRLAILSAEVRWLSVQPRFWLDSQAFVRRYQSFFQFGWLTQVDGLNWQHRQSVLQVHVRGGNLDLSLPLSCYNWILRILFWYDLPKYLPGYRFFQIPKLSPWLDQPSKVPGKNDEFLHRVVSTKLCEATARLPSGEITKIYGYFWDKLSLDRKLPKDRDFCHLYSLL